jgi:protein MAK11
VVAAILITTRDAQISRKGTKVKGKDLHSRKFYQMAKRKLQATTSEKPRDVKAKKAKVQHISASEAKTTKVSKSTDSSKPKKKPVAVVPEEPKIIKPNALRIVVGSYEKVLCGIDARFTVKSAEKVSPIMPLAYFQRNLTLNPVYMFSAHTGAIKCLAANNRYLVSGGSDEVIKYTPSLIDAYNRIYDLKKRKDLGSLVQHNGAITALQFYSKTHLLSASEDGTICIWRTRDWECMATMKGHKGRVNGMCVHPSGKIAISVGKDKALRLWNLMTGRKASVNKLGEGSLPVYGIDE